MGNKKYCPSGRGPLVRPVRLLHGLSWGTGPLETGFPSSHIFLPDGGTRRRSGRRARGFNLSSHFLGLLGIRSRFVAFRSLAVHCARQGQKLVALLQPVGPTSYRSSGSFTAWTYVGGHAWPE